jgi:hypothetical protein
MKGSAFDIRKFLQRAANRSRRPSAGLTAALLAATAAIALLIGPAPASANNDPHRIYLAATPFDLPASYCGFPVHIAPLVDKEYAKVSQGADGSTIYKTTGSLFVSATNAATGKTIRLNVSGPGILTVSPDGTIFSFDLEGLTFLYAVNLTQLGFPSNVVVTSGRILVSIDARTGTVVSLAREPHVLLDVCAALSS